ncbi:hypothetical protein [Streptomyces sp. NPDC057386]|uniref:hypothetical protein n=1 Tax=Streptomyces TaxID=1883 RepID=UPI00336EBBB6
MNERTVPLSDAHGDRDVCPGGDIHGGGGSAPPNPPGAARIRQLRRERSRDAFGNATGPRPGPAGPAAARRWKLWLLTVCGIYPTIVLLGLATGPLLEDLYLPVRLAVLVPAAAAAMVWQIMPRLQRRFGAWLAR